MHAVGRRRRMTTTDELFVSVAETPAADTTLRMQDARSGADRAALPEPRVSRHRAFRDWRLIYRCDQGYGRPRTQRWRGR